jgi:sugar phosphate isomerase/epimerase
MRDLSTGLDWLSINTATVRKSLGQDKPLNEIFDECARLGIRAVSPWREQVAAIGLQKISRQRRTLGLKLSGYCRGGLFPYADAKGMQRARDENCRAIDEACELEAPCLVVVVGGLPGALEGHASHKNMEIARDQVRDGIADLLEYAKLHKMPLAIEPLHPMFAADRACVNTLEHALDLCDQLDPENQGALGVAIDVYHVWWDPKLQQQIQRAGGHQESTSPQNSRILAFHVCDWLTPTVDLLNDRGMMGDGVIDIPKIRGWVEDQGFRGFNEVEIFSIHNWWKKQSLDVLTTCISRHQTSV